MWAQDTKLSFGTFKAGYNFPTFLLYITNDRLSIHQFYSSMKYLRILNTDPLIALGLVDTREEVEGIISEVDDDGNIGKF